MQESTESLNVPTNKIRIIVDNVMGVIDKLGAQVLNLTFGLADWIQGLEALRNH